MKKFIQIVCEICYYNAAMHFLAARHVDLCIWVSWLNIIFCNIFFSHFFSLPFRNWKLESPWLIKALKRSYLRENTKNTKNHLRRESSWYYTEFCFSLPKFSVLHIQNSRQVAFYNPHFIYHLSRLGLTLEISWNAAFTDLHTLVYLLRWVIFVKFALHASIYSWE